MNLLDDKVNYFTAADGSIRHVKPKIHMSKKERLKKRWEGRERFSNERHSENTPPEA